MAPFEITQAIHVVVGKLQLGVIQKYGDVADIGKSRAGS